MSWGAPYKGVKGCHMMIYIRMFQGQKASVLESSFGFRSVIPSSVLVKALHTSLAVCHTSPRPVGCAINESTGMMGT